MQQDSNNKYIFRNNDLKNFKIKNWSISNADRCRVSFLKVFSFIPLFALYFFVWIVYNIDCKNLHKKNKKFVGLLSMWLRCAMTTELHTFAFRQKIGVP
jgi:hypothetical protein